MSDLIAKILPSLPPPTITVPNIISSINFDKFTNQGHDNQRVRVDSNRPNKNPDVFNTNVKNKPEMFTFPDSSATNHCFADRMLFTSYAPLEQSLIGLSARSTFDIVGKGSISFSTTIDGVTRIIDINDVLHTPSFQSNLISISKLIAKGANVNFNKTGAIIQLQTGEQVMSATKIGELFTLDMDRMTSALITQSKRKSVTFDIWHR